MANRLMDGSADLALHQISEIKAVSGAVLVGPIPAEIQNYTVYAAAQPSGRNSPAVESLLAFLRSPRLDAVWRSRGMEPMGR